MVDAASIEVNRRARRAKTDRLDGDKLLAMLLRHHAGERVWSVLREPSAEAEDARRTHRELGRLMHERIAHTNRIGSLLVLHNLRPHIVIGGRDWAAWWERHSTQVPPLLRAEIERESLRTCCACPARHRRGRARRGMGKGAAPAAMMRTVRLALGELSCRALSTGLCGTTIARSLALERTRHESRLDAASTLAQLRPATM